MGLVVRVVGARELVDVVVVVDGVLLETGRVSLCPRLCFGLAGGRGCGGGCCCRCRYTNVSLASAQYFIQHVGARLTLK